MTGSLDRWTADASPAAYENTAGNPAYKQYLDGVPPLDNKSLPRVYPMVDINTGLRFNLADRVVFRFEGGLHTIPYYGMSAGVAF